MPEQIIIPANDEISVYVRYMPSVLDATQTSDIRFQTESIGRWDYLAFGIGTPPTQFEPKIVTIGLNKDFSSVILFKNPFKDPIQVIHYTFHHLRCHSIVWFCQGEHTSLDR